MTKHEIEIEGLPEGWRAVEAMIDPNDNGYVGDDGNLYLQAKIKLEKIPPRRIVLEETEKDNFKYTNGFYANQVLGNGIHIVDQPKIWRVVKEDE